MKAVLVLLIAGTCGLVRAQTNSPAPGAPDQEVGVRSQHGYYDGKTRQLVYDGDVVATNAQGQLTCGRLTITLSPEGSAGSHPTNIVAETNVVIDFWKNGETNHITSDKAIYAYGVVAGVTNETITFTGHAQGENSKVWVTGEPLVWDNIAEKFTGMNFKTIFKPAPNSGIGTNAPAATNELTTTKIKLPPGTDTNYPPGKLDLVPSRHPGNATPPPGRPPLFQR